VQRPTSAGPLEKVGACDSDPLYSQVDYETVSVPVMPRSMWNGTSQTTL
jgi:hypothetical protein